MADPSRDLFRSTDTRCWDAGQGALVLSFEQTRPLITTDVLDALERAVGEAERSFATLVIASSHRHFAFGAALEEAFAALLGGHAQAMDAALDKYQRIMLRLRHASVPTVAAVRGVAISGACELLMHCTRVVACRNSHIGLAEASVGVIPGGGGLKELALRAAQSADPARAIVAAFDVVAVAAISSTAAHARELGFLTAADCVDAGEEPLREAIEIGLALHTAGHVAPLSNPSFQVVGAEVQRQLKLSQSALLEAGTLTAHQFEINRRLAQVLCGGDVATLRSEAELLALERQHFVALAPLPLTQARLAHVRRTGKALMN